MLGIVEEPFRRTRPGKPAIDERRSNPLRYRRGRDRAARFRQKFDQISRRFLPPEVGGRNTVGLGGIEPIEMAQADAEGLPKLKLPVGTQSPPARELASAHAKEHVFICIKKESPGIIVLTPMEVTAQTGRKHNGAAIRAAKIRYIRFEASQRCVSW